MSSLSNLTLRTARPAIAAFAILFGLMAGPGCGGKKGPIDPGPIPEQLQISCPPPLTREATTPQGTDVHFESPAPTGGQAPYTVLCEPGSGSVFALGQTIVRCTASDTARQQAACDLLVTVHASQMLTRTKFLAFGDSITAGVVRLVPLLMLGLPDAYPAKVEQMLRTRYPSQDILVANYGQGGETASEGVARLPGVLAAEQPEVLLLLEGVNNISRTSTLSIANNLRTMVSMARANNVDVIIATLTPVGPPYTNSRPTAADNVRNVNERIAIIAAEFGLGEPVDLYGLFQADMSLLGSDGLHPTADGYTRIAEAFTDAIVRRYDQRVQSLDSRGRLTRLDRRAAGR